MLTAMAADQRDCHQEQVSMVGCELALNSPGDQVQLLTCVMASDSEREMPGGLSAGQNHQTRPVKRGLPDELEVSSAIKRGKVSSTTTSSNNRVDLRLLVRRREAGALIGKQGANIKRMRDQYKSSTFNIPDTGNGPERVVCISADGWQSMASILAEISQLFLDKSAALNPIGEDQVELKQLVNSAYAGSLIGIGGQSIRKLRNVSVRPDLPPTLFPTPQYRHSDKPHASRTPIAACQHVNRSPRRPSRSTKCAVPSPTSEFAPSRRGHLLWWPPSG